MKLEESHALQKALDMTFPSEKIGVMEDDIKTQRLIIKSVKRLGFKPVSIKSADDAVKKAKKGKLQFYILDINMGEKRSEEGLTALERLKEINENIVVGILTAYTVQYKQMAYQLHVDVFREKTSNQDQDVGVIMRGFFLHERTCYDNKIKAVDRDLGLIEHDLPNEEERIVKDVNYRAYQGFRSDPEWLDQYGDYYVAFVGGKLVDKDMDRFNLISRVRRTYPTTAVFFTKVEKYETIIDIPSPFSIDDL